MAPTLKQKRSRTLFSSEDLENLDKQSLPKHIAIIMDGNRRWARKQNLPVEYGHIKGAERLKEIVQASMEIGIESLTVYAFSTENWKRPQHEVGALMELFKQYLLAEREELIEHGIKVSVIGNVSKLEAGLRDTLENITQLTSKNSKFNLVIALNYGSRAEITEAVKKIANLVKANKLLASEVDESTVSSYLGTHFIRDPDLLIRTSGEYRLSNFLLWQLAYSEIWVDPLYWPEFGAHNYLKAIKNYSVRDRRRGS